MPKLKCPNPVNGKHYGLLFTNGISEETKNKELINRLKAHGYEVVKEEKKEKETPDPSEE